MSFDGTAITREYRQGLPVSFDQFEAAIWCLAPAVEELDYDGLAALVDRARRDLTIGTDRPPSLVSALMSHATTGSYLAARDEITAAFQRSGAALRRFEHNPFSGPRTRLLERLGISAGAIADDVIMLTVRDYHKPFGKDLYWYEAIVAEALGVERALRSITVTYPLEMVGYRNYRLDFGPLINGLSQLGIGAIEYSDATSLTPDTVADWLMTFAERPISSEPIPTATFDCSAHPGIEVSMTITGCQVKMVSSFEQQLLAVLAERNGNVITGPRQPNWRYDGIFDAPELHLSIAQPPPLDGAPAWPSLTTPELKAPLRNLAAQIATMTGS